MNTLGLLVGVTESAAALDQNVSLVLQFRNTLGLLAGVSGSEVACIKGLIA